MMHVALFFFVLISSCKASIVTDLLANYDAVLPPNYSGVTNVNVSVYIENFVSVDEGSRQFSVTLNIISQWNDSDLAYNSTTKEVLDLTPYIAQIWIPNFVFTRNVKDKDILDQRLSLSRTGILSYTKRLILSLKCPFNYRNLPLDKHDCSFVLYPLYYDQNILDIQIGNEQDNGKYVTYTRKDLNSFDISSFQFKEFNIATTDVKMYYSDEIYKGLKFKVVIERIWNYYLFSLIIPSILFCILSYCGFWIDKNGVPGRVYLGSLAILININAYTQLNIYDTTWLGSFLLGCITFGCLTMVEYCILNYCMYTYTNLSKKIEEMITDINKEDLENEHEIQVLDEVRKSGLKRTDSKEIDKHIIKSNAQLKGKIEQNQKVKFELNEESKHSQSNDTNNNKQEPQKSNDDSVNDYSKEEDHDDSHFSPNNKIKSAKIGNPEEGDDSETPKDKLLNMLSIK